MRRGSRHGDFRPHHGVEDLRHDFSRLMRDDPEPPPLSFRWMVPPRLSSIHDVIPGSDVALRLIDDSVIVGHYVSETALRIRFRPWGLSERFFAKSEICGACLVGAHSWAERHEVTTTQAAEYAESKETGT